MSKTVIGLLGRQGGGKQSLVDCLRKLDSVTKTVEQFTSGGILVDLLKILNLPPTRQNLQKISVLVKDGFGKSTLAEAMGARISASNAEIVIYDSIRWTTDEEVLRSFPNNILVYVDTDKEERYRRLKNRKQKADESDLPREKFEEAELAPTEVEIGDISTRADYLLDNNGSEKELLEKVRYFARFYGLSDERSF